MTQSVDLNLFGYTINGDANNDCGSQTWVLSSTDDVQITIDSEDSTSKTLLIDSTSVTEGKKVDLVITVTLDNWPDSDATIAGYSAITKDYIMEIFVV